MGLGGRKHMVASLLPLLVSLSFTLSALGERGWESSDGPLRTPPVTPLPG